MTVVKIDPAALMDHLMADEDGTIRDAAMADIELLAGEIKRQIDAGVAPAEFQVLSKVHAALEQSVEVVKDGWTLLDKRRQTG